MNTAAAPHTSAPMGNTHVRGTPSSATGTVTGSVRASSTQCWTQQSRRTRRTQPPKLEPVHAVDVPVGLRELSEGRPRNSAARSPWRWRCWCPPTPLLDHTATSSQAGTITQRGSCAVVCPLTISYSLPGGTPAAIAALGTSDTWCDTPSHLDSSTAASTAPVSTAIEHYHHNTTHHKPCAAIGHTHRGLE